MKERMSVKGGRTNIRRQGGRRAVCWAGCSAAKEREVCLGGEGRASIDVCARVGLGAEGVWHHGGRTRREGSSRFRHVKRHSQLTCHAMPCPASRVRAAGHLTSRSKPPDISHRSKPTALNPPPRFAPEPTIGSNPTIDHSSDPSQRPGR